MASSVLRGLHLLETLAAESAGVSELARRTGQDKAAISRTLATLAEEGWVLRIGEGYRLGPRAIALAGSAEQRALVARSHDFAHLVSGLTGLTSYVAQLAGPRHQVIATASAPTSIPAMDWSEPLPLVSIAAGIALLAQLPPDDVEPYLAVAPWPRLTDTAPTDAQAVRHVIDRVRSGEPIVERGWVAPGIGCIAMPWPGADASTPTSFALIGYTASLDADLALTERILRAAVAPGASRESIIVAAQPVAD